jgi:hypothetical protein
MKKTIPLILASVVAFLFILNLTKCPQIRLLEWLSR